MNFKDATTAIENELDSVFLDIGLQRSGCLTWKQRIGEGIREVRLHVYKHRYMPSGVAAFTATFSICDLQLWPVVKKNVCFRESAGTWESSIYHCKGRDSGTLFDLFRRRRLRTADYGFSDARSLSAAVESFRFDIDRYILEFFRQFPNRRAVSDAVVSRSQRWNSGPSPSLVIALMAMDGQKDGARRLLEKRVARDEAVARLGKSLFRTGYGADAKQRASFDSLRRFIEMVGPNQLDIDLAVRAEEQGDVILARTHLDRARQVMPVNDFIRFREAVCEYRVGQYDAAIDAAEQVVTDRSLYRDMALELLVNCALRSGNLAAAEFYLRQVNELFFERNGYRSDASLSQFDGWMV